MAQSGETVTYAELKRRSNRLAHFLRASGLGRLDHYAIFMENNARYVECCSAGERAGLYYTCISSYLTPEELAYILDNSESKILITSTAKHDVALRAMAQCPRVERCLVVDGSGDGGRVVNLDAAVRGFPATPIPVEALGTAMLYSSGTTGRPKGILRPLPDNPPAQVLPLVDFFANAWRFRRTAAVATIGRTSALRRCASVWSGCRRHADVGRMHQAGGLVKGIFDELESELLKDLLRSTIVWVMPGIDFRQPQFFPRIFERA